MKNKHKTIALYFLSIIAILAAISVPYFQKIKNSEKALIENFKNDLWEQEKSLDKLLVSMVEILQTEKNPEFNFGELEFDKNTTKNFSVLVYQNDSLIFWSDNSVPISPNFIETNFTQGAIEISNGWYDVRFIKKENFILVGLIPVKYDYSYENLYLKNHFSSFFSLDKSVEVHKEERKNIIQNSDGDYLFSLTFPIKQELKPQTYFTVSVLYFLFFIFLIAAIYNSYRILSTRTKRKNLLILAFIFDLLLFRFLLQYFKLPEILYDADLFGPELFASSFFLPSLGDLLANLVVLFVIFYAIYNNFHLKIKPNKVSRAKKYLASFLLILIFGMLFQMLYFILDSIVINSSFSLNLAEINSINIYSVLGLLCFGLLILSFVFLTLKFSVQLLSLSVTFMEFLAIVSVSIASIAIFCNQIFGCPVYHFVFLYIYILSFWVVLKSKSINIQFSSTLFYILLFSIFSTYILYHANNYKEKEFRKLAAINLSTQKDPVTEFKFDEVAQTVANDSLIIKWLSENSTVNFEDISYYIEVNYFKGFWLKYDLLLTICDTAKDLDLQSEGEIVNCFDYFGNAIEDYGHQTNSDNLYYLDNDYTDDYYLGFIDFSTHNIPVRVFVELFPKSVPKGLGYPELLVDQAVGSPLNWSVYSYARYENQELAYRYGKYYYSMSLSRGSEAAISNTFYDDEGYSHMSCQLNDNTVLIISKQKLTLIAIIAPFSYISILFGLMVFLLFLIVRSPIRLRISQFGFKKRLQFSVILIIVVSFLFVGIASLFYIVSLNDNKNYSILSEKTHSVLIELEHKLAGEPFLNSDMEMYLSDLLYKFSLVFFSDINMYDLNGTLLATSRPEIFNEGLKSSKMNPGAFLNLKKSTKSLFVHQEKIGDYQYLSAYIPFRNEDNKIIAYLNLPYFAKQDELTNEVSTFLVAFININVILVAIAIFIVLLVSNYILKPIQLLKEKISRLQLGKTQEKLEWSGMDEIGGLVQEYNRMVDELTESAELLAKSERESAWREMAQQIAHEIKNPLTPMKLSVQYLQKAWNEKAEDWDKRLERFTKTIVEQIDSLSIIASEFSNFANMPRSNKREVNIVEIINNSIGLYRNTTKIQIHFDNKDECIVLIDREQLLRVFNNLIKNSIQAISEPEKGEISISIDKNNKEYLIRFSDNGKGILEDQKDKVFYPRFTTKTSGMGLGLAMVKSIIENSGGTISFESETGKGTSFYITLPSISA